MTAETRPTAVAPLDRPNLQKRTPLHTSAERGNTDLVRLYMKKGADILAQDENGWISLHLAVRNGHRPTVEALLDKEYPTLQMLQGRETVQKKAAEQFMGIGTQDNKGQTALHLAVNEGNKAIIQLLLDFGWSYDPEKSLDKPDNNGRMALDFGAKKEENTARLRLVLETRIRPFVEKHHEVLMEMLMGYPFSHEKWLKKQDKEGQTALHLAAKEKGNEAVVQLLLDFGHRYRIRFGSVRKWLNMLDVNKQPAIYWAAKQSGNEEVITLLMDKGAHINKLDEGCLEAVLEWAVRTNRKSTVKRLLNQYVDATTGYQKVLGWVMGEKSVEMLVLLLVKKGLDVNKTDNGQRALQWMVSISCAEAMEMLIRAKCKKQNSSEALYYAVNFPIPLYWSQDRLLQQATVIRTLLKAGADVNAELRERLQDLKSIFGSKGMSLYD